MNEDRIYIDEKKAELVIEFTLDESRERFHKYVVLLGKTATAGSLANWLAHLYGKSWLTAEMMKRIIYKIDDYYQELGRFPTAPMITKAVS